MGVLSFSPETRELHLPGRGMHPVQCGLGAEHGEQA